MTSNQVPSLFLIVIIIASIIVSAVVSAYITYLFTTYIAHENISYCYSNPNNYIAKFDTEYEGENDGDTSKLTVDTKKNNDVDLIAVDSKKKKSRFHFLKKLKSLFRPVKQTKAISTEEAISTEVQSRISLKYDNDKSMDVPIVVNDRVETKLEDLHINSSQRETVQNTFDNIQKIIMQSNGEFGDYQEVLQQYLSPHYVYRYYATHRWEERSRGKSYEDAIIESLRWRKLQQFLGRNLLRPMTSHNSIYPFVARGVMYVSKVTDEEKRAILYIRIGRLQSKLPSEIYTKLVFHTVERACQYSDQQQSGEIIVIIDMKGFSWEISPSFADIKEIVNVLRDHYPYRIHKVYIVNVGYAFLLLWSLVQALISSYTLEKIHLLSPDNYKNVLSEELGSQYLEIDFGGTVEESHSIMM